MNIFTNITLYSKGQKARVSMARVAYSNPTIAIFDDPLSALDAGTSKTVFDKLFKKFLSSSAVFLVTHASNLLHYMDHILILSDGKAIFSGTCESLAKSDSIHSLNADVIKAIQGSIQDTHDLNEDKGSMDDIDKKQHPDELNKMSGKLMTVEEKEYGLASLDTWLTWCRNAGGFYFVFSMTGLLSFDRMAYVATEWWLVQWTGAAEEPTRILGLEFPSQIEGRNAQVKYVRVYVSIFLVSFVAATLRSIFVGK